MIDRETSINAAMAVGIGALFTYGYIMGRSRRTDALPTFPQRSHYRLLWASDPRS